MEILQGEKSNQKVHVFENYMFLKSGGSADGHVVYYRCKESTCSATAKSTANGLRVILGTLPRHDPDLELLDKMRLKDELRRLARTTPQNFRKIYDEVCPRQVPFRILFSRFYRRVI